MPAMSRKILPLPTRLRLDDITGGAIPEAASRGACDSCDAWTPTGVCPQSHGLTDSWTPTGSLGDHDDRAQRSALATSLGVERP
jgi:hypothetical protein